MLPEVFGEFLSFQFLGLICFRNRIKNIGAKVLHVIMSERNKVALSK